MAQHVVVLAHCLCMILLAWVSRVSLFELSVDWQFALRTSTCALLSMHSWRSAEGEFVSGWTRFAMR